VIEVRYAHVGYLKYPATLHETFTLNVFGKAPDCTWTTFHLFFLVRRSSAKLRHTYIYPLHSRADVGSRSRPRRHSSLPRHRCVAIHRCRGIAAAKAAMNGDEASWRASSGLGGTSTSRLVPNLSAAPRVRSGRGQQHDSESDASLLLTPLKSASHPWPVSIQGSPHSRSTYDRVVRVERKRAGKVRATGRAGVCEQVAHSRCYAGSRCPCARMPASCPCYALLLSRADHPDVRTWHRHTEAICRACGLACTTSGAQHDACMPGDQTR
jgi:hypothetical protein